jgi:3-methyladenine DNA glycosylase/8-oxoguanine DNA glycosylase
MISLRASLCELPGVGAKVANCVMLFAYERLRAFPIDVWIERVLREKYFPRKRKMTGTELRHFCESYFGQNGGYAQQYLFHYARKGDLVATERKSPEGKLLGQTMCDIVSSSPKLKFAGERSIVERRGS